MKIDWTQFVGKTVNITMNENYGVVYGDENDEQPTFYEIVFKTGKLEGAFDDGLLLETTRDDRKVKIFVRHEVIKCVEIFENP